MFFKRKEFIKARRKAGLTVPQVADISGVNKSTIFRYEMGHRVPTVDLFCKMVRAINGQYSDFLL